MRPTDAFFKKEVPDLSGPIALPDRVKAINAILLFGADYWQAFGAQRTCACQFNLTGDGGADWYISIDAAGATAAMGSHAQPDVVWESDLGALESLFKGRFPAQQVRLQGDLGLLRDLFTAMSKTKVC